MKIIKKEIVCLNDTERDALNEVCGLMDEIEGFASDTELIRFAEHIRNYISDFMNYIEED